MWVRFLSDYDHRPRANVILAYLEGQEYSVTRDCGEAAIAAGKAVEIPTPNRGERDGKKGKPEGFGTGAKAAGQNPKGDKSTSQARDGTPSRPASSADESGRSG